MERKSRHFRTFADDMKQFADFSDVADRDLDGRTPLLPNGYFSYGDALALTTVLATRRPAQYVEVGSGNSTKFARRAIGKYKLDTKIECINPIRAQASATLRISGFLTASSMLTRPTFNR
ncbi:MULTISPECIES: hypothetical protein [Methylobacterium]|uniref:hypothetical protein n=1 Tax=Methylobacterium TaxID=407 RepID=UPI001477B1A0|nr:hypothetical protein [Methylobacterium oryzae]UIN34873.1 hypothetical protein LXM90_28105 [Methylobacterium oryzae]